MGPETVVLLSGGLDSATALAMAVSERGADKVAAVTFSYGQRHSSQETRAAVKVSQHYGIRHVLHSLPNVFAESGCALLENANAAIRHESYAEQIRKYGKVDTYVPFRNGVLIANAAAYAVSVGASEVWYGAHRDDTAGEAYPDCTPDFHIAMAGAVYAGSGNACRLKAPFLHWSKADIVGRGLALGVPYHLTWSCYEGEDKPCGKCATCIDGAKAFALNGVPDPAVREG